MKKRILLVLYLFSISIIIQSCTEEQFQVRLEVTTIEKSILDAYIFKFNDLLENVTYNYINDIEFLNKLNDLKSNIQNELEFDYVISEVSSLLALDNSFIYELIEIGSKLNGHFNNNYEWIESEMFIRVEELVENGDLKLDFIYSDLNIRNQIAVRCSYFYILRKVVWAGVKGALGCSLGAVGCILGVLEAADDAIDLINYICNNCGCE
ncbi:MAG TPA: hypothetical protein PKC30_04465 [Saprospiraceae bacterium]|nr:hypothetical protein [Saprospiraceae bacterium]